MCIRDRHRPAHRQSSALQQSFDTSDVLLAYPAKLRRELCSHQRPRCDGLSVQPLAITHPGFNRMTEGVAQVEQGSFAALTLIRDNHFCLVPTGTVNGLGQRCRLARQQAIELDLEPFEDCLLYTSRCV